MIKSGLQALPEQIKLVGDGAAAGISVAAILGWLPYLTAIGSLIWLCLRIYNEVLEIKIKKRRIKEDA